jgi:hypothetical protein
LGLSPDEGKWKLDAPKNILKHASQLIEAKFICQQIFYWSVGFFKGIAFKPMFFKQFAEAPPSEVQPNGF